MSSPQDCCTPCTTTPVVVNIPGPEGPTGTGVDGQNGVNAYGIATANFLVPADLVTPVLVLVNSSIWNVIGQILIIGQGAGVALANPGPATFQVVAVPSPVSLQLLFLHYPGDVGFGTSISAGAIVSPSGRMP